MLKRTVARSASLLWLALCLPSAPAIAQGPPDSRVPMALLPPYEAAAAPVVTLARALEMAARRNEDIAIAAQRVTQAAARRDGAWASFKPTLSARGTFTHHDEGIEFGGRVITKQDEFSGAFSANLQIVNARAIKSIEASYAALDAARADAEAVRRGVLYETARTYYSVAAAKMLVAVARRNVELSDVTLTNATERLEAGVAIPIDVSRAKLTRLQAERDLVNAGSAVRGLEEVLRFLTGIDGAYDVAQPEATLPLPPDATIAGAVAQKPDIDALRFRAEAADDLAEGAWYQLLPRLSAAFNYQLSENTGFSGDVDQWNVQLVLEWLLYDGGARYAEIEEARAEREVGELLVQRAERAVTRDVRRLALDLRAAALNARTALEQRDVARQQYELVHERLLAGSVTSLEVADADAALFRAESEVVRIQLEEALVAIDLIQALGIEPFVLVNVAP
jgi:outer membrane protein TolC